MYNIGLPRYITVHILMIFKKEKEQLQKRNHKITVKITPYARGKNIVLLTMRRWTLTSLKNKFMK